MSATLAYDYTGGRRQDYRWAELTRTVRWEGHYGWDKRVPVAFRHLYGYSYLMIKSFAHKGLEVFFKTGRTTDIQAIHTKRLNLILAQLNQARSISDLDIPTLRLHTLKGSRKGIWAVTVQANWRITFRFVDGDAEIVNYEDYH